MAQIGDDVYYIEPTRNSSAKIVGFPVEGDTKIVNLVVFPDDVVPVFRAAYVDYNGTITSWNETAPPQ